ncbi:cytochrome b/b6 domain-containing protein [Halomonas piscis]|uniref:Cytochrome b/b6 domain-containing protein n=2 Tax=Halomonas TaxID=2745 RepID=A0ABY9YZP5_9GAMM|nr:cytochrome b/b6 domain-containing protein [Halomonas piscis]WNK20312.1 cytochrome b/b6 domain-containing protein [Halomonas piscis]
MTDTPKASAVTRDNRVKVWDPAVRVFHWSLVAAFAVAYFTPDSNRDIHEWSGYVALGLVFFRLVWGVIGSRHARFSDFVSGPKRLSDYLRRALKGQEPRYIGHNPAAAIMILFLLAAVGVIGVSGWLLTTDWGWGSETIEEVHEIAVNITLVAIALHVAAAIYESVHHRENLVRSMVTGHKRR